MFVVSERIHSQEELTWYFHMTEDHLLHIAGLFKSFGQNGFFFNLKKPFILK